jgi:hypothetical protein
MQSLKVENFNLKERWSFFIIVITLIVLTTLPYILLFLHTPVGQMYGWTTFLNPGDNYVYYSYINQVKSGNFLVNNLYTNEITNPTLQLFWLGLGLVGRIFSADPVIIFHIFRLLLIPVFVFGINACLQTFISGWRQRILALAIFFFTSGLGWLYVLFKPLFWINNEWQNVPFDILSTDAFPFLSVLASPHLMFSWLCLIYGLTYSYLAFQKFNTRDAFFAGLFSLLLFLMHPFFIPLVYAIVGLYAVSQYFTNKKNKLKILKNYLILFFLPLPAVGYYVYLFFFDWATQIRMIQNLLISPKPSVMLLSFGTIISLAIFGAYEQHKKSEQKQSLFFLGLWIGVVMVMLYVPFLWQRRFVEGWYFPLVILASYGVWFLKDRAIFKKSFSFKYIIFVFISVLLIFSNLLVLFLNQNFYTQKIFRLYYVPDDFLQITNYVKDNTGQDAIFLLNDEIGFMTFPYFGKRKEYVGHIVESVYVHNKTQRLRWFFGTAGSTQTKYDFLLAEGIDYIIYNSEIDNLNIFSVANASYLQLVFTKGSYGLYQVL